MRKQNNPLSEQQKSEYIHLLERDKNLDFEEEFIRTTNLERNLVDKYGFEGIKLIFTNRNSENYFELSDFPNDCPWFEFNNLNITEFISEYFSSVKTKIPDTLEMMNSRCCFIYSERTENDWKLHYYLEMKLYDERDYFTIFTGGSPNKNPQPNNSLKSYDWDIPNALSEFYSFHDGFGNFDNSYILGSDEISVMAEMMNPIIKKNNFDYPENYKFEDLLEFFPDGAGNAQCFYRENMDSQNAQTVDWDHEVWEISEQENFFGFIDNRLSQIDEE